MKYSEEKTVGPITIITRAQIDGSDLVMTQIWKGTNKIMAQPFRVSRKAIRAWGKELQDEADKHKKKNGDK